MIYILKHAVNGAETFLKEGEYSIGRKNCDILLENDQSISRKHAIIRVKGNLVTLEDCNSKYHTLHKGVKINPKTEIKLCHMDLIQFGTFNSKFRFESYNFITTASGLSSSLKISLKENILKCGGKLVDKWSTHCTHLTVEKITLTVKVLQALIDEKPIVTPGYWVAYAKSIETSAPPPDITEFNKIPVSEQLLKSDFECKINPKRKTLFKGKVFVFLTSNMKEQMEGIIKGCGGECVSWEDEQKTFDEMKMSPKQYIIIKTDDDSNESFNAIIKDFAKLHKRPIPLNEIALAVIHCSCEVNCNPDFNKVGEVFRTHTEHQESMDILIRDTETQHFSHSFAVKSEHVIPATVEEDLSMIIQEKISEAGAVSGMKRLNTGANNGGIFKKPKLEKEDEIRTTENAKMIEKTATDTSCVVEHKKDQFISPKTNGQKRKAEEDLELNTKRVNPFSLFKPSTSKENQIENNNPFELIKKPTKLSKQDAHSESDNPFNSICIRSKPTTNTIATKVDSGLKRTPFKQIRLVPVKSDTSFLSSTKRSVLNCSWMSKSNTTIKHEVSKIEDPDVLKIIETFKDCVKVETLPPYQKLGHSNSKLLDKSVNGGTNFKSFKKVAPRRSQIHILGRKQFIKIESGEVTGIDISNFNDSDDDIPDNRRNHKPKIKKFIL